MLFRSNNIKELIATVQSQPGKWTYASSGSGGSQHLAMEMIRDGGGKMDMTHVPYKGFGQGLADVLSGQVAMIFAGPQAAPGLVQSGKLKALGITSKTRSRVMPNVPAVAETLPGFQVLAWCAFFAPAATPRDIVRKINTDAQAIIKRPDFQERALKDNLDPVGGTPEQLRDTLHAEYDGWKTLIPRLGIKPD